MKSNPKLNYWLEIKNEKDAKSKILVGGDWEKRTEEDMERIIKTLGVVKEDRVLDFGCGIGRLVKEVAPLCKQIIGVDVSDAMIMYAFKYCLGLNNVLFIAMQSENKLPTMTKIDKIYSFLTMQHIEKPKAFSILNEFNHVLKKFGKVLIQYPNVLNKNFYFTYMNQTKSLGLNSPLIEFYSKEEIIMIYEIMGFEIINIEDTGEDFYVLAEKVKDVPKLPDLAMLPIMK